MGGKIVDFPTENSVIHIRSATAVKLIFGFILFGFMSAGVIFSHVGTQNHTDQAEKALTAQIKASEERVTKRIEEESAARLAQYLAAQQQNLSNYQMSWAHMVKLTSTIERAGFEAPPMPEE